VGKVHFRNGLWLHDGFEGLPKRNKDFESVKWFLKESKAAGFQRQNEEILLLTSWK
jgi:hypothetical protein